jgi:hypothetical protein
LDASRFQFGAKSIRPRRDEFERFVKLREAKGITLIGVTMPFAPQVVDAMNRSAEACHLAGEFSNTGICRMG